MKGHHVGAEPVVSATPGFPPLDRHYDATVRRWEGVGSGAADGLPPDPSLRIMTHLPTDRRAPRLNPPGE